jgi:hypothetical protein
VLLHVVEAAGPVHLDDDGLAGRERRRGSALGHVHSQPVSANHRNHGCAVNLHSHSVSGVQLCVFGEERHTHRAKVMRLAPALWEEH